MSYNSFKEIVEKVRANSVKRVVAVAGAEDSHVLEAVLEAKREGIAEALLVGEEALIKEELKKLNADPQNYNIVNVASGINPAIRAVELVKEGYANFLMKGRIETRDMLKPVVDKANNLHTGRVMSHMAFNEIKGYHKLIVNTDGGMLPHPTQDEKKQILINAVETLHLMGYEEPKVAILCGVERVNPKMPETVDADSLQKMAESGEIPGCKVVGPISYDLAMSREIAEIKKYNCPYCGDFDVLLVPNLVAGNLLGKCLTVTAGATMAGMIVGAKVPVILTSRGASSEEKFLSIALSALI